MNSGAKIKELQELGQNKRLLAAQREMYSTAKRYDAASCLVSLGLPVVVTLLQIGVSMPFWVVFAIAASIFVLGLFLESRTSKLVKEGARVQQLFDAQVYGIGFENTSNDKRGISNYADKYLAHAGDLSEFDDWYTVPIRELKPGEAVLECQRQNSAWSYNLGRRFMTCGAVASILLCAGLAAAILVSGVAPETFTFLFCVFEWPVVMLWRGTRMLKTAHSLPSSLERHTLAKDVASLKRNQESIFEYRSSGLLVPDWFYRRSKGKDDAMSK